jgi:hypothetical protein
MLIESDVVVAFIVLIAIARVNLKNRLIRRPILEHQPRRVRLKGSNLTSIAQCSFSCLGSASAKDT